MTMTSARPIHLGEFVDRTRLGHADTADEQRRVASLAAAVGSRCIDFHVDTPALGALATVLDGMVGTDRFVSAVREALLAADGDASTGVATVATAEARSTIAAARAADAPEPIEFEPATLTGLPVTSGFVDDPICAANGNMIHQDLDLHFPGVAAALDLRRTYNSLLSDVAGAFGLGISSILDVRLTPGTDRIEVRLPDGATAGWVRTAPATGAEGWGSAGRRLRDVEHTADGYEASTDHRHAYRFDGEGRLVGWRAGVAEVAVTRDSAGNIVTLREERSGRRLHLDWVDARVAQIATDDGRTVSYTYGSGDTAGRIVRVATVSGHLAYEWDEGRLHAVVDADGVRPFRNEYDETGRVIRQISPFGRVTTYRYEAAGLTVITDLAGTRQAMVHDRRGNLTAVIDGDGAAMRLTYDHADRVTRVVDRDGATWEYAFDPLTGELTQRVDPDGLSVAWTWDDAGRVRTHTDRAGQTTTYAYPDDRRVATPCRILDPAGGVTEIDVDTDLDRPRRITDADGVVIRFHTDRDGQVVAVVDALGHRTELSHDDAGHLVRRIDPLGTVTTLTYEAGRLAAYDRGGMVGTFTRSAAGRIVGGTEPGDDHGWTATLGEHGAPLQLTDAGGGTLAFEYDEIGNVTAVTTGDGDTFHHFHDEIGRLIGAADPSGATSHRRYDHAGRVVELTDAEGRTWRRDVDRLGRTVRSIAPDGAATEYTYHPAGPVATVRLPDGRVWATSFDHAGRVAAVTDPAGRTAHTVYSPAGRVLERRSPSGNVETYEYDIAGRCCAVVAPTGVRRELERDAAGRLIAVTQDGTRLADLERDRHGRITTWRTPLRVEHDEFDVAGRLVSRTDGTGARRSFTWTATGLLATATDAAGDTVAYDYDPRGRLIAQMAPGERTTRFDYDPAGHLHEVTDPAGVVTRFVHDASGVPVGQYSGSAGWTADLDAAGRVTRRSDLDGDVLAEFGYDATGRLTEASVAGWTDRFLWDPSDRLAAIANDGGVIEVTPPVADPSITEPSVVDASVVDLAAVRDAGGRLRLGADGTAYHYDDAGRLARLERPDGTDLRYRYDDQGLLAVEHGPGGARRFRYDEGGRVVAVMVEGVGTTTYAYDDAGRRVAEHYADGGSLTFEWAGLSRLVAIGSIDADGIHHRVPIICDAFGRPIRIGDDPVERAPVPGRALADRHGRPVGARVGDLTFLGARVHDAATRQFLSPDPLLSQPGTPGAASAYTATWHDPVNFVDPSGRRPIGVDEWQTIRSREEQGRVGQFADAITDDPWGTLAAVGVTAVGAGLCFTPFAPIGAGILIGVGSSAAIGFATGTFDPRDAVLSGAIGGFGGGLAHAGRAGLITARGAIAAHGAAGATEEFARQTIAGEGYDLGDIAGGGAAGLVTAGVGEFVDAQTITHAMLAGAGSDGLANAIDQALSGDGFDTAEVVVSLGSGAVGGAGGHYADTALGGSELRLELDELGDGTLFVIDLPTIQASARTTAATMTAGEAGEFGADVLHPEVPAGALDGEPQVVVLQP